jgi:3-methyladenine DNA glycosylase/8-oxoguanine DNA glycosylase
MWHVLPMPAVREVPLKGPRGEPIDFARTIVSHAVPELAQTITYMFRLDEDLSGFYALVQDDELSRCATGAGRMLRAPTVFEDVVKTT